MSEKSASVVVRRVANLVAHRNHTFRAMSTQMPLNQANQVDVQAAHEKTVEESSDESGASEDKRTEPVVPAENVKINKRTGKPMYEMKVIRSSADAHKELRRVAQENPYSMQIPAPTRSVPLTHDLNAEVNEFNDKSADMNNYNKNAADKQSKAAFTIGAASKLLAAGAAFGASGVLVFMAALEYGYI